LFLLSGKVLYSYRQGLIVQTIDLIFFNKDWSDIFRKIASGFPYARELFTTTVGASISNKADVEIVRNPSVAWGIVVNTGVTEEGTATAELADHLLRFSRAFYEAFRLTHNRLRFWRLLFLILEKQERDGLVKDSFTIEEMQAVLGWSRPPEDPDRWRRQLIKQFADARGRYLELVEKEPAPPRSPGLVHQSRGRPPQTRIFKLSAHFESAAKAYVKGTAALVQKMPIPVPSLDKTLEKNGAAIFQKEMDIISQHYYSAYTRLMDELIVAVDYPKLAEAFKDHAPYWTILLVAWKQHNQDPKKSFNRSEFETDVRFALRKVDKKEVNVCFAFMIESKILEPDPESIDGGYLLSKKCMPALGRYAVALKDARKHLASMLNAEFGVVTVDPTT
jgi:hypothetical protein